MTNMAGERDLMGGGESGGNLGSLLQEAGVRAENFEHNQTVMDSFAGSVERAVRQQPMVVLGLVALVGVGIGLALMTGRPMMRPWMDRGQR